jgi:hypothetical protein
LDDGTATASTAPGGRKVLGPERVCDPLRRGGVTLPGVGTKPSPAGAPPAIPVTPAPLVRSGADLAVRRWSPRARLAGLLAGAAVAAGACARVYAVDPAQPGHYPTCPFKLLTSLDCPGCGTLRGLHQALHGHLGAAANRNLFFVIAAPLLVGAWIIAVARIAGWRRPLPSVPSRLLSAIPVLVIAFWIARNLPVPGCAWLHS